MQGWEVLKAVLGVGAVVLLLLTIVALCALGALATVLNVFMVI